MTLSLQEISDRLEIHDVLVRYSHGLDQRKWEEWDLAFTDDSVFDYSAVGMSRHSPAELIEIFSRNDAKRISGQHLLSNILITIDKDRAAARSEFTMVTMARADTEGKARRARGGGWYEDDLERLPVGWRIMERRCFVKWTEVEEVDWAG